MNTELSSGFSGGKDSAGVLFSVTDETSGVIEFEGSVDDLPESVTSVLVDDSWPGQILVEGVDEFGSAVTFLTDNLHGTGLDHSTSPVITVMDIESVDESDEEVKRSVDRYYSHLEIPAGSSGDEDVANATSDPENVFFNKYLTQYKMDSLRQSTADEMLTMESDMKGGILHATMPPHHASSLHSHSTSPYGALGSLSMMNIGQSQLGHQAQHLSHQQHLSHNNNSSSYGQTHTNPHGSPLQPGSGLSPNGPSQASQQQSPPTTGLGNHHITSTGQSHGHMVSGGTVNHNNNNTSNGVTLLVGLAPEVHSGTRSHYCLPRRLLAAGFHPSLGSSLFSQPECIGLPHCTHIDGQLSADVPSTWTYPAHSGPQPQISP